MAKPVLFAVDDDPDVLQSIIVDLRRHYSDRFRILYAGSGASALDALRQLKLRSEPVALFLVDQRMPKMTGVEFLERVIEIFPDAKRVLLTAYADTDAAIRAINVVGLDQYLMKPWDPPEERLYPVLDDLLDDWMSNYRAPFEGVRVFGHRWVPETHHIKQFLARHLVPYQWLDVETSREGCEVLGITGLEDAKMPLLIFPDGSYLEQPTDAQIAEKIGLKMQAEQPFYDLVIVGAGPAGLGAAVYGASEGLRTLLIEKEAPGGQAGTSSHIENYLGFPVGLSGADLTRRAVAQAKRFGVEILTPQEAVGITVNGPYRTVKLADGSEVNCHAVLIATGVSYRKLEAPGLSNFTGVGVYYGAAMTEGPAYRGRHVMIVGAGNSAGQAAVYFSKYARDVTLIARGSTLATSMSQYLIDKINAIGNITVCTDTEIIEAHGNDHLESVTVRNLITGQTEVRQTTALFIFIGATPPTEWLANVVDLDEQGYVLCGPSLPGYGGTCRPKGWPHDRDPYLFETSTPGIFVAGDVRHSSVKRVATAVGEGAMVVQFIHLYLGSL